MMKIVFAPSTPAEATLVAYPVAKGSVDAVPATAKVLAAAAAKAQQFEGEAGKLVDLIVRGGGRRCRL